MSRAGWCGRPRRRDEIIPVSSSTRFHDRAAPRRCLVVPKPRSGLIARRRSEGRSDECRASPIFRAHFMNVRIASAAQLKGSNLVLLDDRHQRSLSGSPACLRTLTPVVPFASGGETMYCAGDPAMSAAHQYTSRPSRRRLSLGSRTPASTATCTMPFGFACPRRVQQVEHVLALRDSATGLWRSTIRATTRHALGPRHVLLGGERRPFSTLLVWAWRRRRSS